MSLTEFDVAQEGRISTLEVKVSRIVDLTEDLHADMKARHARWSLLGASVKYFTWLAAGVVSVLGLSKTDSVAGWLSAFPHH